MRSFATLSLALALMGCTGGEDPQEDADGDGFGVDEDCNDEDAAVNPDAEELCDGVDNDCDGVVDPSSGYFTDADGDGFGDPDSPATTCEPTEGVVPNSRDCDDDNAGIHPDAAELCDGVDNNCSGTVDEDPWDGDTWHADADGDGFGSPDSTVEACEQPAGYVADDSDCNDGDPYTNPDATQYCVGFDADCNQDTTEEGMATWVKEDGTAYDVTSLFAGSTREAPVAGTLPGPGAYYFCEGTHHVNLELDGDTQLMGLYGPESTTLSGAGQGSVVRVLEGNSLSVRGLTLTDGYGVTDTDISLLGAYVNAGAGGALACEGGELDLSDVWVFDSWGTYGGGLYANDCDVRVEDSVFSGNSAYNGGAIVANHGTLTIIDSEISGNQADYMAGGVSLGSLDSEGVLVAEFDGVVIDDNEAALQGGGIALLESVTLTLTGNSSVTRNRAYSGGGAFIFNTYADETPLTSEGSDWGTAAGGDDNESDDVSASIGSTAYGDYGDNETFSCSGYECW